MKCVLAGRRWLWAVIVLPGCGLDKDSYSGMDEVDLTKIPCIPHPKSIAIMNQYLLSATQHVNKMSDYAEKELLEIDFMIDELENKVHILERKIGITVPDEAASKPASDTQPSEAGS